MALVWSFGSFAFFLIPLYIGTIKADIYHMAFSTELAELLGIITCIYATRVMTLKNALMVACGYICFGSIVLLIFMTNYINEDGTSKDNTGLAYPLILLVINWGINVAFDLAYLINVEYFPPSILATAYGICNLLCRLISILSPFVAKLPSPYPQGILIFFSAFTCVMASMLKKK